jgi:hypothetical protein
MTLRTLRHLLILLAMFPLFPACYSGSEEGDGRVVGTTVQVGDVTCVKTCVESGLDECQALCDECWDTCASVITRVDCSGTCRSICDCTPAQVSTCLREGYVCSGGEPDPEIESACEDLSQTADARCNLYTASHNGCERVSRVYREDAAALYACQAEGVRSGVCDSDRWCSYTPSTLGTDLCAAARERCGECPFGEAFVDGVGLLLKRDWREAGEACLDLDSCTDVLDCLWGWREAIGSDY